MLRPTELIFTQFAIAALTPCMGWLRHAVGQVKMTEVEFVMIPGSDNVSI